MDTKQVNDTLDKLFREERIVFWNDPDREFVDYLSGSLFSPVQGVNVIRFDQTGMLEAKLKIERSDPDSKFLVYSPTEEPNYDEDWLLDIRLYSRNFRADRASIVLDELGLQSHHLREHLADRRKFCDNKDRLQKLKSLVTPEDNADDLDRKMLAVVVKADQPELYNILRTLLHFYAEEEEIDLRVPVAVWDQIEKFDLAEPFWRFIKRSFGYTEETPSLENLLLRLLVTDFAQHLHGQAPSLAHLVLPQMGRANAVVCLAHWRDSASKGSSYDRLSEYVSRRINLGEQLHHFDIDHLIGVPTFVAVETEIARNLKDRVLATADAIKVEDIRLTATLSSQLSVLPSYTALGMASLLPHKKLEYDAKGNILVDGKPCASSEQRNEILASVDGVVLRADELLKMKKEEGRDAVAGKKVVYIYHDEIDSRGEKPATEGDTFEAVRKAINELGDLIRFIINSLNGNYIVVTADHGFLFTETKPDETHKSKIDHKPAGTVHDKKRYLLGRKLPDVDGAAYEHSLHDVWSVMHKLQETEGLVPITAKQIDALLPFLERFEAVGFSAGTWKMPEGQFPWFDFNEAVMEFHQALYDNGWVTPAFDWTEWQASAEELVNSPKKIEKADATTIQKLLTTHSRADRFREGHLASMFENGHIVALLRRLKTIREKMKAS